jgi:hypothetical protein
VLFEERVAAEVQFEPFVDFSMTNPVGVTPVGNLCQLRDTEEYVFDVMRKSIGDTGAVAEMLWAATKLSICSWVGVCSTVSSVVFVLSAPESS